MDLLSLDKGCGVIWDVPAPEGVHLPVGGVYPLGDDELGTARSHAVVPVQHDRLKPGGDELPERIGYVVCVERVAYFGR